LAIGYQSIAPFSLAGVQPRFSISALQVSFEVFNLLLDRRHPDCDRIIRHVDKLLQGRDSRPRPKAEERGSAIETDPTPCQNSTTPTTTRRCRLQAELPSSEPRSTKAPAVGPRPTARSVKPLPPRRDHRRRRRDSSSIKETRRASHRLPP
jgi:hypothetical protein